jgi:hypothetical protein
MRVRAQTFLPLLPVTLFIARLGHHFCPLNQLAHFDVVAARRSTRKSYE